MHGLIFVTWEKYLVERFGDTMLSQYRSRLSQQVATPTPLLASHVYDDATLIAGVGVAHKLTNVPIEILLREYGRYFQMNGLTNHFCAYVVNQFQSGRDLLLAMSAIHEQLNHVHRGVTPPIFAYELPPNNPHGLILIYDSVRQLCPVLLGAIEGAAERYDEHAEIVEHSCMQRGDRACRFEVTFIPLPTHLQRLQQTPEQKEHHKWQNTTARLVLSVLPMHDSSAPGFTLQEIQMLLRQQGASPRQLRLAILLDALLHLSYAGLVTNSAHQPGSNPQTEDITNRRYWRVLTHAERQQRYR